MKKGYVVLKATCDGFCNDDIRDIDWEAECSAIYPDKKTAKKVRTQMIRDDIKEFKATYDEFDDLDCDVSEEDGVKSVEFCIEGDRAEETKYYIKEVQIMD